MDEGDIRHRFIRIKAICRWFDFGFRPIDRLDLPHTKFVLYVFEAAPTEWVVDTSIEAVCERSKATHINRYNTAV